MFDRNRHLNIFEHYKGLDTLPIENNISRGFAIVLDSYPLALDQFIDYLNAKCAETELGNAVPKPERATHVDIGFQQNIKQIADSYSDFSLIVGITLTASLVSEAKPEEKDTNSNLITDIVVAYDDIIIIIEVKRTNEDASGQCKQQIDSLVAEIMHGREDFCPTTVLLDGSWEEVIRFLQNVDDLLLEDSRGVLHQYLEHLNSRYQHWFPVRKFTEIDFSEQYDSLVEKRIAKIAQNTCESYDQAIYRWGGYTVPTSKPYVGGALIVPNYGDKTLDIKIWVADTKNQGRQYFDSLKADLSWIYEKQICVDGQLLDIKTAPYIRFAHWNSTKFNEYLNESYCRNNLGMDKSEWFALWKAVSYEWKRENWSALEALLTSTYEGAIERKAFHQKFESWFLRSKRGYVHVSLGFEVTVQIPYSVLVERELKSSVESISNDALALFVKSIINNMIYLVE